MVLTFGEAYKIVCPNGGEVRPNSKEYKQIMGLMAQSGHVPLHDRLVKDVEPKRPMTVQEAKPYIERAIATQPSGKISKKQWLSIDVHREAFIKHLNKK